MKGQDAAIVLGIGAAAAVGAIVLLARSPKSGSGCDAAMSQAVLARIDPYIGATYGDALWAKVAPGYDPTQPGTSCGVVLGWALAPWMNTRGGTGELITVGRKAAVWTQWTPDAGLPCPGSAYALGVPPDGAQHVGLVESATLSSWTTIDGGQGSRADHTDQHIERVIRTYDPVAGTLAYLGKTTRILGWINSAKYASMSGPPPAAPPSQPAYLRRPVVLVAGGFAAAGLIALGVHHRPEKVPEAA